MVELLPETKICTLCKQRKPKSEFFVRYDRRENRSGLACRCKKCTIKSGRDSTLQRRYGITESGYIILLNAQNGVCALCGKPETRKERNTVSHLAVDHNHKTLKIRGLLCYRCNTMLGKIENLPGSVQSIVNYLKRGE